MNHKDINIVIPCVGRGSRVKDIYSKPKPLIEVEGKPIILHAAESLGIKGRYIFIIRKFSEYGKLAETYTRELENLISRIPNSTFIRTEFVTEGPVNSVLIASNLIDNSTPLLTVNCDQRLYWDSNQFLDFVQSKPMDGCLVTCKQQIQVPIGEKSPYSYVKLDQNNEYIIETSEKLSISSITPNGASFFSRGSDFVEAAKEQIRCNDRVNNEFYISKTYNHLIKKGKKITIYPLKEKDFFYPLGMPDEINRYLYRNSLEISKEGHKYLNEAEIKHLERVIQESSDRIKILKNENL